MFSIFLGQPWWYTFNILPCKRQLKESRLLKNFSPTTPDKPMLTTSLSNFQKQRGHKFFSRGGSMTVATSKMELFMIIVNSFHYYHKVLNLGYCSSLTSTCVFTPFWNISRKIIRILTHVTTLFPFYTLWKHWENFLLYRNQSIIK